MTGQQKYALMRSVILIDIPLIVGGIFAVVVGWPMLITWHQFFAGLAILLFVDAVFLASRKAHQVLNTSGDNAKLISRQNWHAQEIQERQNWLEIDRQEQQLLPPPSPADATFTEIYDVSGTSPNSLGSGGTAVGSVPSGRGTTQHRQDDNVVVDEQLRKNPLTSMSQMEKITGIPRGSILRTNAWKNRQYRNA